MHHVTPASTLAQLGENMWSSCVILALSCIPHIINAFRPTIRYVQTSSDVSSALFLSNSATPSTKREGHVINVPLQEVLNMRDLATASSSKVAPGKFFRTGCVSNATPADISKFNELGIKVWIDLRSETELNEDDHLHSEIYDGALDVHYDTGSGEWKLAKDLGTSSNGKMRYFISLMSESKIKKGVFQRLEKRNKLRVFGLAPLSLISRRMDYLMKRVFLNTINSGGLQLLNELAIEKSPETLVSCLKVIAQETKHKGIGIFCTAGKDRTGLIAALVLSVLGASDEEIVADYILSDQVYNQLKSSARVASLSQNDLNPEVFLRAKAPVIIDTIDFIRREFGSIDAFLDTYGFDESWRLKMRENMGTKL